MAGRGVARHEGETARRAEIRQLWPELTFHYGITPAELKDTPNWMLRIYADALPQLLARQQLGRIEAMSFSNMDDPSRAEVMNRLRQHLPAAPAPEPKSVGDARGLMAMTGIGMKFVDKDGNEIEPPGPEVKGEVV